MIIALIAIFIIIVLMDLPGLLKTRHILKSMLVYFLILTLGFSLSLLITLEMKPISPSVLIKSALQFITPGGN